MSDLTGMTVAAFSDVLASGAPAPGGGSAAALSGALGCALGAMVCELSIGKKRFLERGEWLSSVRDALNLCRGHLLAAVDADTQAFGRVSAAYRQPREQPGRQAAIQQALIAAARSPLQMLGVLDQALALALELVNNSNPNCASDLGTAAAMLLAGAEGAWMNVLINIGSISDAAEVYTLHAESRRLYNSCVQRAGDILAAQRQACNPQ